MRLCARAAEETDAWNIGGVVMPTGRTPTERAVAAAMDSPFGGVLWTRDAKSHDRVEVDMVHCGAYRPEGFERVGLFDESLVRNQDDDMAFRLRAAGGKVILDPGIRSHYIPRGSLRGVLSQYYQYGFWKVLLQLKHRHVISGRSLAPPAFLASLLILGVLAPFFAGARRLLLGDAVQRVAGAQARLGALRRVGHVEHHGAGATGRFRPVHRGVGVAEQRLGRVAVGRSRPRRRGSG